MPIQTFMMEPNYLLGKRVSLPPAYRGKLGISTFAENYNNLQHVKRGLEIEVLEMICLWEA